MFDGGRYIAKAKVWLERDQLPTEEDCWAALATVDRLNTHNFDYYRDGRSYRPIEAFTRRRDKRRWSDTSSARVAASRMDDEEARDWIGPTVGRTRSERLLHRKRKQNMSANIFVSTLMSSREEYGCDVHLKTRRTEPKESCRQTKTRRWRCWWLCTSWKWRNSNSRGTVTTR